MSERTLGEIIDDCQSGGRPDYDDMRYAICALQSLSAMDLADERANRRSKFLQWVELRAEEAFQRRKRAYAETPKKWLGAAYDPDSPEVQRRRRASLALYERVTAETESRDRQGSA